MGSASREALAQARSALGSGAETGAQLLAAATQLRENPALAGALGDAAAEAQQKQSLVGQVFTGVSSETREVLSAAAAERWSHAAEFVSGVEELGIRAEARVNASLSDELLAIADLLDREHELQLTLGSKLGEAAHKVSLISGLLQGKASASAISVVSHLVGSQNGRLDQALRRSARVAADEQGTELATVTVAQPLSLDQADRLSKVLEASAGRPVKVTTIIDPSLIGGVRVQLADDVIDGSVRSRLEDLRQQLAA